MNNDFIICDYLNEKFKTFEWMELVTHFVSEFGVDVKKFENKYMFKYDTILADYNKPITHECRGVILYYIEGVWSYHSRPFKKFFNIQEGKCEYFDSELIARDSEHLRLVEKRDGSCVQVAYDIESNGWRASTLGSIETANVFDYPYTFSDLFWRIFNNAFIFAEIGATYIFELWSKENQVVTDYGEDNLTLLAIRGADSEFKSRDILEVYVKNTHIRLPYICDELFTSREAIEEYVEAQSENDMFGSVPEGFVLCDIRNMAPVGKSKNRRYIQYHHINTGDRRYVLKNIAECVFDGNIDDMYGDLNDVNRAFVDRLRAKLSEFEAEVSRICKILEGRSDKKDFAVTLNSMRDTSEVVMRFSGMFFEYNSKVVAGEPIKLTTWLTEGRRFARDTFMSYFKMI